MSNGINVKQIYLYAFTHTHTHTHTYIWFILEEGGFHNVFGQPNGPLPKKQPSKHSNTLGCTTSKLINMNPNKYLSSCKSLSQK